MTMTPTPAASWITDMRPTTPQENQHHLAPIVQRGPPSYGGEPKERDGRDEGPVGGVDEAGGEGHGLEHEVSEDVKVAVLQQIRLDEHHQCANGAEHGDRNDEVVGDGVSVAEVSDGALVGFNSPGHVGVPVGKDHGV